MEEEAKNAEEFVQHWLKEIKGADAHENKWRIRAKQIVERYRDERSAPQSEAVRYNVLFANTEILKGTIYQQTPRADVRQRFKKQDQVAKAAAKALEDALMYSIDQYDFDGTMDACVLDHILVGRGLARVRYIPQFIQTEQVNPETGQPEQVDQLVYEEARCEYVDWEYVRISPAKKWSKVRWIAFGELLTREDLKEMFPKVAKEIKMDWSIETEEKDHQHKRALVWTIWDKKKRQVIVITSGYDKAPLAVQDDPLKLEGFFPCPEPLYSITTTNSLIPVPEYTQYQDQAREMDDLTSRINALVDALRRRGVYDGNFQQLRQLANAGDNEFIPIEQYAALVEKGGLEKAFQELPIEGIAKVVVALYQQREQVKQSIYEITGISDILRGASDPNETARAQEIKSQYGSVRITKRQKAVQKFARDLLRLKAEIIAEHFSTETLALMTGMDLPPEAWEMILKVLRNDKLRSIRIDIETDSTIRPDQQADQQNRIELMTALTNAMRPLAEAVQAGAMTAEGAQSLLKFSLQGFKLNGEIEEVIESSSFIPQAPQIPPQVQEQLAQSQEQIKQENDRLLQERSALEELQKRLASESMGLEATRQKIGMDIERIGLAQQKAVQAIQGTLDKLDLRLKSEAEKGRQFEAAATMDVIRRQIQQAMEEIKTIVQNRTIQ